MTHLAFVLYKPLAAAARQSQAHMFSPAKQGNYVKCHRTEVPATCSSQPALLGVHLYRATKNKDKIGDFMVSGWLEFCFVNVGRWLGTSSQPATVGKETDEGIELELWKQAGGCYLAPTHGSSCELCLSSLVFVHATCGAHKSHI